MDELKPCPFCGSKSRVVCRLYDNDRSWVHCGDCFALGPPRDTQVAAIAAWNRRAEEE